MISDADFGDITEVLGKDDLQNLFHALGLRLEDIEKIESSTGTMDVNIRARKVLHFWRQRNGNLATRQALLQALARVRNRYAIEQLDAKWNLKGEYMHFFKIIKKKSLFQIFSYKKKELNRC